MLFLRWILGIACSLALAGFVLIMIVGKGIRSAYQSGAGTTDIIRSTAVYAIPILLAAMLASLFLPTARGFLHAVAVGVIVAMVTSITIIGTHPGEGSLYFCFFGLWMIYYFLAAWKS
jgi:hypothetical protein